MENVEKIKEYTNGEITILWEPAKCIHAGECVKALPKVYDPKAKPWIKIENATTDELKSQINKCPSAALSYKENKSEDSKITTYETKIEVLENGPLLIYGTLKITDKNGNQEQKNKTTAFCRCGASENKPYCDGAHTKINFSD
ncbi:hypothetical protein MNBD_BACTEROID01-1584 [hydrothermal vent metagenome]|uniref:Iron-binding zinc finger CDGSH type domain-containing protein n=1 Tax=hydrothermal vent metagenome TaxID=652676 RepID=A0A3B0U2S2_9ZZZZ